MNKEDNGRSPANAGSGHQPSGPQPATPSSQSGVPNAFTPGPWSMTADNLIRVMQKGTGVCVAGVHRIGRCRDTPDADTTPIANARLISSAPDLFDALEKALPWVEEWSEISDYPPGKAQMRRDIADARTAIAKARGQ